MPFPNYHTHCHFCDGKGAPAEYLAQALLRKMPALGFSSHAPLPFPTDWNLRADRVDEYLFEIGRLREEYAGRIEIYTGMEIDFIPGIITPRDAQFAKLGLDYCIGSVHYLKTFPDRDGFTVDCKPDQFAAGLDEWFGGDAQALVKEYYARVRQMLMTAAPDIVGHLDLPKVNNPGGRYFSEEDAWYRREVTCALEAVAASGAILEINTGGINKGRLDVPYPSRWALEQALRMGIPVTLSADAHRPWQVDGGFTDAARMLRELGFDRLKVLLGGEWREVGLS